MRSTFAIWTCSLVACGGDSTPPPRPVVASIDETSELGHTCMDIYDAANVDGWMAFCKPADGCTLRRGRACEAEHRGGCLQRDGSITWQLSGTTTCLFGQAFTGEPPPPVIARPFHCTGTGICQEMTSVFDLFPTSEPRLCASSGGDFAAGPCPPEGVLGRCRTDGGRTVVVFYPPDTLASAKAACADSHGEWR